MARKNKLGRTKGALGRFVALPHYFLNSLAWKTLPLAARCALVEVLQRYSGMNNGQLAMSARVLSQSLDMSRATAARAMAELVNRGILEIVTPSSFQCKAKRAAEYRVTLHRCDVTGALPSKAFLAWKPEGMSASNVARFPVTRDAA